ncbi:BREX-2 system adenine-specific DNA-methyltransferase PglX [Nonomuraea cavernae]|uniref:site-specific DNA-methyltransferase (adenine-specific) n=1 Tax=Nonomuraea cavernae TaxID=2045107 RepID=A0A918DP79_9ACTN|nr:BREX-2 system adenine-specific DNA-methyltransferase PglX [Nonomuraea cavernae]MCA2185678.1 BREX-2 system adenine-specific DNA-methyltransferase PglX [Nonomuraea cavernae]GGO75973.1 DNA methylase [Nonomuraea cavernae]
MIDRKAVLDDLKQQVKEVEADLAKQVRALPEVGARLRAEYDQARKLERTAATWGSWLDERVTQVAAAWVLGTVFVRFCEDNRLIEEPYLTAPEADRRDLAQARYEAYVETDDDPTYRGWLRRAFAELGEGQAGRLLFDPAHNPLFQIPLSHDGAGELVEFWRRRDEAGELVHDFAHPLNDDGTDGWDTRFLGDLYQDLSEAARKTYALLQTPDFVERFILDRTMDPAVREFGHRELKMIDPTCGSGHFVLGAFQRLVRLWADRPMGLGRHERVRAALDSVHGVDLNPFAVAIARFRLLVAAMAAAGVSTMKEAAKYEWPIHLAVGDSLIKARQMPLTLGDEVPGDPLADFAYATEDVHEHPGILEPGRYHVVVGNPPYVTVKDKKLNELYRGLYDACAGTYALSVPFAQRFFELAVRGDADGRGYGMVGQITANSFMKREFGAKLIEEFFAHKVELTEVIDTSGAYIPGHGTPTVILVGTPRAGRLRSETVRTVRSVQGEPSAPEKGEDGLVWGAIVDQIDDPGSVSPWVSVGDLERKRYFGKQPWILADGGLEMVEQISNHQHSVVRSHALRVGFFGDTHADEAFTLSGATFAARRADDLKAVQSHRGDQTRDWGFSEFDLVAFPYDSRHAVIPESSLSSAFKRYFWKIRTQLWQRTLGTGKTYSQAGREWWAWHQLPKDQEAHPWSIPFAEVATHNHFVLDRGGKVFNRTAPVIKLREEASEKDHLYLLGLLNSSTAALWLKLNCHDKGNRGGERGTGRYAWESYYQFNGSNIERFPLPATYPTALAVPLDALALQLAASQVAIVVEGFISLTSLRKARARWEAIRARMIALQEELDWQVYSLYTLHPEDLRAPETDVPELALGERAFEIVLARRIANGEASDEWFRRHRSTPIQEIPSDWPESYRQIVQKRIDAIESSRAIGMVERPEYKRRWATEGWDVLQEKALRSWLLDRIETRDHWYDENGQPTILTLARLVDVLSRDEDFVSVAAIYAPRRELAAVVSDLVAEEHVPFLAALRYKPTGLKKRADWEEVWDLQRKEDAAPDEPAKRKIRDSIPVPPKYAQADFQRASYWRARGKLDVPKERFISYGQVNTQTPDLYGWAGWDHREQAQALATYFTNYALTSEEITPFLAGLLELQPWLHQWHDDFDPMYSGSPADFFAGYRQQIQGEHGLTDDNLRQWRPAASRRAGRTR